MFLAWLFALMSVDVVVDSTHRQIRLYLKSILRYLLVIVSVVLLFGPQILSRGTMPRASRAFASVCLKAATSASR